jgi:RNA polymerase sigma-70 factor (ECF subfamily)
MPTSPLASQLERLRPALLRFALFKLYDRAMAEDAVHDTMLALLEHPERFAERASLLTYATSILRFKIVDALRAGRRVACGLSLSDDSAADAHEEHTALHASDTPHQAFERRDFLRQLDQGLQAMPARAAQVFVMRYALGLSNAEICQQTGLGEGNLWTVQHRARSALARHLGPVWAERGARFA